MGFFGGSARATYLIGKTCFCLMLLVLLIYQNCTPFIANNSASSSAGLTLDNPTEDDRLMSLVDSDLFSVVAKYFPGQETEVPKARIFRLTQTQIDLTTQGLLGSGFVRSVSSRMPKDPLQTNYEFADLINFNPANISPYTSWVEETLEPSLANSSFLILNCNPTDPSLTCLSNEAQIYIEKAFRKVAPSEVVASYLSFFMQAVASEGALNAEAELVDLVFNSPYYLCRSELATDERYFLKPSEYLQNLTYTIADVPYFLIFPANFEVEQSASTPEFVKMAVDTTVASNYSREKLIRFFKSWLEIKEADELSGFEATLPGFNSELAQAMVAETDQFLRFHLEQMAPKLKNITQSTQSFIGQTLNQIYNNQQTSETGLVDLNERQRMGVFTQSSFIASHSGPDDTRLVKRGVFFTRKVMCLEIGSVPGDVVTDLPPDNGQMTERQRIELATNNGRCLGCHRYINPFGFNQENYNPLGQWRTEDQHGLPIDTQISVDFLDQGAYNGQDPIASLKYFTESMRFKQCFVRQLFRFYMGRREKPSDDPLLRKMFFYFALNDEQDILGLLNILASSSRFSQRVEEY